MSDAELQKSDLLKLLELFNIIAMKLINRYERIELTDDIDRAIKMIEKIIELISADYSDHVMYINIFENVLESSFKRIELLNDLDHAIATRE